MKFTDLELDALSEVFNLGVGQAAHALSQLAGETVALTVPQVELLSRAEVAHNVASKNGMDQRISAVKQNFHGELVTDAVLMFPADQSLQLVQIMVGEAAPLEQLGEMEQEALAEIGNILLNSVVASVADCLKIEFEGGLPEVQLGVPSEMLLAGAEISEPVLSLQIQFEIATRQIKGYLAFLLDVSASELLEQKVAAFIGAVE